MSSLVKEDLVIRRATLEDLRFIEHLSTRFSREVGFIPRIALENRITGARGGYVGLATENDDPAGFLHTGSMRRPECRIFQAAICYDAQRRHLGQALVGDFLQTAQGNGVKLVTLRCLSDLDANSFWQSMGFRRAGYEPVSGTKNRGSTLIVWAKRLHTFADLMTPGFIPPQIPMRLNRCKQCGLACTYTRGPKGELWKLCATCVRKRATVACRPTEARAS